MSDMNSIGGASPLAPDAGSNMASSYPSPASTTASPNIEETTSLPVPQERHADSQQHSLRAASAALQAAYRRIRQVRRSLVELTEPLPSLDSDAAGQYLNVNIGPDHSALLLTASPVDESSDTDDAFELQGLRAAAHLEYIDRFAALDRSWSDQHSTAPEPPRARRHVQLPSPTSSAEPSHQPLPPRRSLLESQLARRRETLNPDDPSTYLGRRVAAREAAGPSRSMDPPQPLSYVDPILRAVEMERELLHLRTLTQRHTDPAGMAARVDALSRSEIIRAARSLDMESFRTQRQQQQPGNINTNVPVHVRPLPNARRWRAMRAAETRQNSSNTQSPVSSYPDRDRLSLLSNLSVQNLHNLSTPTSAIARDRPLLFEEPLSYAGQPTASRRESRDTDSSERSYFIHRRVNAEGEELVHNINFEWDEDDPLSWLPSRDSQDYRSSFPRRRVYDILEPAGAGRGSNTPAPPSEVRRRGWARLDPDGNAIPSDEEEELERSRAEYRLRALRTAPPAVVPAHRRTQGSVDASAQQESRGGFSNLITRTSVSPDDSRETTSPRVRLNSREAPNMRLGFGTVMDSVMSIDNRPRQGHRTGPANTYGSAVPYVVDPLPMPLSEMVTVKSDQNGHGIRVSRNACLAGR
ncbi:hypothetical protein C8J57DRAFT_38562 [Mycena rebaudengoi]|nr:hypothetical protein C8J57DRAFT_38562 [Mycena rebaudengoi]